ncbi:hypothetical protein BX666DRAFT_2008598, partial [Dichotomocladium elegans]
MESHTRNMEYWRWVVNLKSRAFKPQESELLQFRGTIHTDGVGVTVFKKTNGLQSGFRQRFGIQSEDSEYITPQIVRNEDY